MRLSLATAALCVAVPLLSVATPASAAGFSCPWKPIADGKQAANVEKLLPTGDAFDDIAQLNAAVYALRQQGTPETLVIDSLVAAYCPVVASNTALTDAQKSARVMRFAARVMRTVYSLDNADAIILDVPLRPTLVEAARAKAKAAGISVEAWIAGLVEAQANR
ncbi:hypothetical protein [Chelatococcus asaccharovorans]|uniref:Glutelin n=1 Tax=Chelatococcus asaccharovorans TaxID=28210 RepID=A0A2V3UEI5_9HYPH|nr:hypothetical protein [Chelatococcus asaccharovorans]MBS7703582.1 hypothetical protein [Chelatococcus asaccharovorans]PXW61926.1 hypothetical protein C7450_103448 [Chelatococcus asaccharovorans]CAH1669917.1 conserved exported hypothetical protein [Chelatococcus asaccharovorans]CAH1678658.1 conserved exported hypothetical protein [Chelatococcus asaccharovorans]